MQECGIVYVTFLDDFCMTYNGIILDTYMINSDKIIRLLSYILIHRNNNISVGELSEALWSEEESDNPANALKNLVYRSRNTLKKYFGKIEFIRTGRGYYSWNKDIYVNIDAESFEHMCRKAETDALDEEKIEHLRAALSCYKKHFLEQYADCYWIITRNAYYHTMYIRGVTELSKLLYEHSDYKLMEGVCSQALMLDELSEEVHYQYMRALISQGRTADVKEHYEKMEKLFYERLCAQPSKKLCKLMLLAGAGNNMLHRASRGAVVCDYEMFRRNCEIEKRRIQRNCSSACTVEFEAKEGTHYKVDGIYKSAEGASADSTDIFLQIIVHSLRESDVVSMYDEKHYIILLSDCKMDDAKDIIKRILDNCRRKRLIGLTEYKLEKLAGDSRS